MSLLYTILLGLVIGLLAKAIMPGRDPGDGKGFVGVLITVGIGILGSVVGGLLVGLIGLGGGGLIWQLIVGTLGAILLLWLYRKFAKR